MLWLWLTTVDAISDSISIWRQIQVLHLRWKRGFRELLGYQWAPRTSSQLWEFSSRKASAASQKVRFRSFHSWTCDGGWKMPGGIVNRPFSDQRSNRVSLDNISLVLCFNYFTVPSISWKITTTIGLKVVGSKSIQRIFCATNLLFPQERVLLRTNILEETFVAYPTGERGNTGFAPAVREVGTIG